MKEFQDKSNIEIIKELMKKNKGYFTSKELDMFDFIYQLCRIKVL